MLSFSYIQIQQWNNKQKKERNKQTIHSSLNQLHQLAQKTASRISDIGWLVAWHSGLSLIAELSCPTLDLQLTGDHLCG